MAAADIPSWRHGDIFLTVQNDGENGMRPPSLFGWHLWRRCIRQARQKAAGYQMMTRQQRHENGENESDDKWRDYGEEEEKENSIQ